jgi:hypothetical protein
MGGDRHGATEDVEDGDIKKLQLGDPKTEGEDPTDEIREEEDTTDDAGEKEDGAALGDEGPPGTVPALARAWCRPRRRFSCCCSDGSRVGVRSLARRGASSTTMAPAGTEQFAVAFRVRRGCRW